MTEEEDGEIGKVEMNKEEDGEIEKGELSTPDPCPECGTELKAKWSGVECINPDCDYWFCF